MRPAGHDASSRGRKHDVRVSDMPRRPLGDQSLGRPPREKRQIKLEERLSVVQSCSPHCG